MSAVWIECQTSQFVTTARMNSTFAKHIDDHLQTVASEFLEIPHIQWIVVRVCMYDAMQTGDIARYGYILSELGCIISSYYLVQDPVDWIAETFKCSVCLVHAPIQDVLDTKQLLLPHNTRSCRCKQCFI